jgi:predicted nucleic acid-binding protein
VYLDTAILVKLLVSEPDSSFYAALVDGQLVWSSQLIVTECYSALLRKERENAIGARHRRKAWKQVEDDIAGHRLSLVPLGDDLLKRANAILETCHPGVALRSLDALHLASAERCQSWPVCSNDTRVREAAIRLGLPLTPLPNR